MICSSCGKRTATFHSTVNINGYKTEEHLCSQCAIMLGKMQSSSNLFGANDFWGEDEVDYQDNYPCEVCGSTIGEILESGFVGCANCYSHFATELSSIIEKMQGKCQHVGKIPLNYYKIDGGEDK